MTFSCSLRAFLTARTLTTVNPTQFLGFGSNCYITIFTRFEILFFMLNVYFISNTSNAKMGPLFYFTLSAESLYNRLQSLLRKLPTDQKGGQTYPILGFW